MVVYRSSNLEKTLWVLVSIPVLILVFCLIGHRLDPAREPAGNFPAEVNLKGPMSGLEITDYQGSQKHLSLKIDTFDITNQKMGFLRLGFMKIACLEGVAITLYETAAPQEKTGKTDGLSDHSAPDGVDRLLERMNQLKDHLPGHIKGIELRRVTLNRVKDGTFRSSVTADRARINPRNRQFIFKGNVEINGMAGKRLSCEELTWQTNTRKLSTSKNYVLEDGQRKIQGTGIETDFELADMTIYDRRNG